MPNQGEHAILWSSPPMSFDRHFPFIHRDLRPASQQTIVPRQIRLKKMHTVCSWLPECNMKATSLSIIGCTYYTRYYLFQDIDDLDTSISIHRNVVQIGHSHPRMAQHLLYLSNSLVARYIYGGNQADMDEAVQASQKALGLTETDSPDRPDILIQFGNTYYSKFKRLGDVADIEMAVSTYSEAAALTPEGSLNKAWVQNYYACALMLRFERFDNLSDLKMAISNLEDAVRLTPDRHPDKPSHCTNLGNALQSRFTRLGDLVDLEGAISNQEKAVSLLPDGDPEKCSAYNNLSSSLLSRFGRLDDIVDLEGAIFNQEKALSLTPDGHPNKPLAYNNFCNALQSRFIRLGELTDLEGAIANQEKALSLTPDGHPDKPLRYENLAYSLQSRFLRLGDLADLEGAISSEEKALSLTPDGHPDKASRYKHLCRSLQSRFLRLGDLGDLERAIYNQEKALGIIPDGHPSKPEHYSTLGYALRSRFLRLGDLADLERAISSQEKALSLTPDGHPSKPEHYSTLGYALSSRFLRLGDLADLEGAISNQEKALSLTPDGHPSKPPRYSDLGSSLRSRFVRLGDLADLEEALSNQEKALNLTPDGHPDKPLRYDNLGNSLRSRFMRLGDLADLEGALANQEKALNLTLDGHLDKPLRYDNLGNSLQSRFMRLGDLADLEGAIFNQEKALSLTPDGHLNQPSSYNNLADAFRSRFERLSDLADLNKAISHQENAVRLTPDGHPDKVIWTVNLARCYELRFTSSADISDLDLTHSLYATAAQSPVGHPQTRLHAALQWSYCASFMNRPHLPAYKCAIDQLPRIAWLGIPVGEQHSLLEEIGGAVRDAVAAAIQAEEYETAVEWMEQGRSIVWQNLLKLRAPVDDLRALYPKLADQLHSISQQLDSPVNRKLAPQDPRDLPYGEIAKSNIRLAIEWDQIVENIRTIPHFNSFLKPKGFDSLSSIAHEGPVVLLNVAEARCDAIALIRHENGVTSIKAIPLKNFSLKKSQALLESMSSLLKLAGVRDGDTRTQHRKPSKTDRKDMSRILLVLWMDLVKPVMDSLAYQPRTNNLPRIWWCATGPLAFLPIHAAGDYNATEAGHKLSDYVVSSYTPTLTAILDSSYSTAPQNFQLLTVAQPSAPGYGTIKMTMDEVEQIGKIASGISVVSLTEEDATVEQVQKGMRESHWVHLACHGKQDAAKPLDSGLILHDGTLLKLSAIIKEHLLNAEFAFLSACQTAMGNNKVAEESVHLAAGMLLAGYKGVIATMWSIKDDIAPQVTEVVYSRMLKDGKPNRKEAAYALHEAVKQLRESGVDFTSWVPFIHIGR